MPVEQKLITCEPDNPNRCQAQGGNKEGQCIWLAVEGEKYCSMHGGTKQSARKEKKKIHDYRLQLWQTRLDEFAESDNVKNLRGEIGVLRLLIENILNQCNDSHELMLYSGKIGDLVAKTEKLAQTCDKFETKVGMLLDKSAALILASRVVEVIANEITDPEAIDRISNGIIDIIRDIGSVSHVGDTTDANG